MAQIKRAEKYLEEDLDKLRGKGPSARDLGQGLQC
jgi:hypothetical protein